jgi:hypothetical protein
LAAEDQKIHIWNQAASMMSQLRKSSSAASHPPPRAVNSARYAEMSRRSPQGEGGPLSRKQLRKSPQCGEPLSAFSTQRLQSETLASSRVPIAWITAAPPARS